MNAGSTYRRRGTSLVVLASPDPDAVIQSDFRAGFAYTGSTA
jgi:hypothetical protein